MNPDQWPRVKELFHAALERGPAERSAFLTDACGGDQALRAEIDRLLAAHEQAGTFIEWSPMAAVAAARSARRIATGQVVNHYEIGRLLGAGGMGDVYVARDTRLGRDVALKVVAGVESEAQQALRQEAQHASRLNHPHICTIYEVGECNGEAYFAMEYVEGRSLRDLSPAGGLPVETAVRYGIQVADALAHAHHHGVIHRDLKSANVVVTPDGRAKVLDFGLAQRVPSRRLAEISQSTQLLDRERAVAGTLPYMAPELLRGEQGDTRSDIWAVGVLLYEITAGRRPFTGTTGFDLSAAILHEPPAPLPGRVAASLQAIISRCLAKDPHARYQNAIEIRSALETVRAELTSGPMRPSRLAFASSRVVLAAIALTLLAALAVGVALTWRPAGRAAPAVALGAGGRPAIAVMQFDNVGGTDDTAWLSTGVPSMLVTGLAQTRGLDIVSAQRLNEALVQAGHQDLASIDKSQMADVARRAGAGAVVIGSIYRAGSEIRIDAQVDDLTSGRVLAADSVRGTDVFALVDQLAARIREGVGFGDAADIRDVADVSTTSLAAYRLYAQGMDASVNVRFADAQALFGQAIALDPTFAEAYLRLAFATVALGRRGERRQYLEKAAEHADRLSERDRLLLEVELARMGADYATAARVLDELIARFPDTEQAYAVAGSLYDPVGGPLPNLEKQLAITRRGVSVLPASPAMRNTYGYALAAAGRYAEAIAEFEAYARMAPREPNPFDSLGDAYLAIGSPERALESYSRALSIDPRFPSSNGRSYSLAILGRYDEAIAAEPSSAHVKAIVLSRVGRYREASRVIAAGIREAEANEAAANAGGLYLVSALLALERADHMRVLQESRAAQEHFARAGIGPRSIGSLIADTMAGLAEVGAGRLGQARARLEAQAGTYRPSGEFDRWWHAVLEREIALASMDFAKAAAAFTAGQPPRRTIGILVAGPLVADNLFLRDGLARIARARGDLGGAIQIYRRLLTPGPDQMRVSALEPRYILQIARLLELSGDTPGARREYRRFLDLWEQADADLPELAEARRALARN